MEQDTVNTNGSGEYEVLEEVRAETVEISQGGAALIHADSVSITQGGAQVVETRSLSIIQGGALSVTTETASFESSAAALISADTVQLSSAAAAVAIADNLQADSGSRIGILLAGTIEGEPDVGIDARTAALVGVCAATTLFILNRLFRRS
jgi:hypothetical protein